ncbi:MAG TPA: serine hydrolase, partial [Flavisolibacter sp.]|nr:serine hydrolase [Flavisolibacter sp.]
MKRVFVFLSLVVFSSCYVFKAYRFRKFELKDLDKIDAVKLPRSPQPFSFAYDTTRYPQMVRYLDENLAASQTYAFLVIRRDTVLYERYFGNTTDSTKLPAFSVAKSVTSTLLGIALREGYIKNLQEPVTNYLPQLRKSDKRFDNVTIQQVLDMRSGVESNESYTNPFSDVLKLGF